MNEFMRAFYDASAISMEFQRTVLWIGVVGVLCCIAWAIQEWGVRKSAVALGWFGAVCLGLASFGSLSLIAVGLL